MSWNSADFRRAGAFCFLFSFQARVSYERPLPSVVYSTFSCLSCQRFLFCDHGYNHGVVDNVRMSSFEWKLHVVPGCGSIRDF